MWPAFDDHIQTPVLRNDLLIAVYQDLRQTPIPRDAGPRRVRRIFFSLPGPVAHWPGGLALACVNRVTSRARARAAKAPKPLDAPVMTMMFFMFILCSIRFVCGEIKTMLMDSPNDTAAR